MALQVEVTSIKDRYAYGESLQLRYRLTNTETAAVYVVRGEPQKLPSASELELLIGEADTRDRLRYFAFKPQPLRQIAPGASIQGRLRVGMPPETVTVDAAGRSNLEEVALSGDVKVRLTVGYLPRQFRPTTSDPRGEFLQGQRLARSQEIIVHIAAP